MHSSTYTKAACRRERTRPRQSIQAAAEDKRGDRSPARHRVSPAYPAGEDGRRSSRTPSVTRRQTGVGMRRGCQERQRGARRTAPEAPVVHARKHIRCRPHTIRFILSLHERGAFRRGGLFAIKPVDAGATQQGSGFTPNYDIPRVPMSQTPGSCSPHVALNCLANNMLARVICYPERNTLVL